MAKTPPSKKSPVKGGSGRPAGLFTWLAIGLVVVVVATLVIIKVTSGATPTTASTFQATDATTLAQVTQVPTSVFNTVGIKSTVAPVTPPQAINGQPELFSTSSTGQKLPEVLYIGAEYCPFCAAQRWSTIIALSRFGTWTGLGNTESSTLPGEVFPGTQTFTFLKAKYASKYLVFSGVEEFNNIFNSALNYYSPLQKPSKADNAIFTKYDTSNYIHGITSSQNGSIPFISIGNKFLVSGSSFTPAALTGLSRTQIATGLSDPTSPVTDAIIASANYQSAAFCVLTKNQPGSVCASPAVMAAKRAMGLK
ncbi:MAG: DUF929 family protein [Acidimicrobiaceae bacterium]|nr:DUF929 family protein [Acidimicrobiaceae bacterium]